MKLSHQSRRWDRMTQINKTESSVRSPRTPWRLLSRPGLGLDQSDSTLTGGGSDGACSSTYQFHCLTPEILQQSCDVFPSSGIWVNLKGLMGAGR